MKLILIEPTLNQLFKWIRTGLRQCRVSDEHKIWHLTWVSIIHHRVQSNFNFKMLESSRQYTALLPLAHWWPTQHWPSDMPSPQPGLEYELLILLLLCVTTVERGLGDKSFIFYFSNIWIHHETIKKVSRTLHKQSLKNEKAGEDKKHTVWKMELPTESTLAVMGETLALSHNTSYSQCCSSTRVI